MLPPGLPATEQEQAEFFLWLRDGFELASARSGELARDFCMAGTSVRLRFAGEALTPSILPGLAHPVYGLASEPSFQIFLWDSESTGVAPPPAPRPWQDFSSRGNIWGFDSFRYRSSFQWGTGAVNVLDRLARQAVFWVPSHQHLPAWVLASPLRGILHWWMELNGLQLVHAAAVGCGDAGVLIPGKGGSGKSSTALSCLLDGMDFIADDYLALAMDPEPRVHRLYTTAKLDRGNLTRYPELASRCRIVDQPGFDKVVLFLEEEFGQQLRDSLRLKLVLRPYLSGVPETSLAPVDASEIERSLSSETLRQLPHVGATTVEFLERVSLDVPHAAIHLGTDRERIPVAISQALESRTLPSAPFSFRDNRPYVSVIVHLSEDDRSELNQLVETIDAQRYPRTEFLVTLDRSACSLADEIAGLPGNIRFLSFDNPVVKAEAWNRAIRESLGELLVIIESGDRLPPGALHALVGVAEQESDIGWVRGHAVPSGTGLESMSPLRGALIRKTAFRQCGLFSTEPLRQGREHRVWLRNAEEKRFVGRELEVVTLILGSGEVLKRTRIPDHVDFQFLKTNVTLRRQQTPE